MMWAKKVLAPIALATGLGFAAMAFAKTNGDYTYDDEQDPTQPEQKKGFDKKGFPGRNPFGGEKKADPQPEPRRPVPQPPRGERADGGLDAWVQTLAAKITDPHDLIRDSARGALAGVGRAAIPALQKLADGDDAAKALAAKRVIAAIEQSAPRPEDGRRGPFGPGNPGSPFGPGTGGRTGFDPNFRPDPVGPGGGPRGVPSTPGGGPRGGPGGGGDTPPVRPM